MLFCESPTVGQLRLGSDGTLAFALFRQTSRQRKDAGTTAAPPVGCLPVGTTVCWCSAVLVRLFCGDFPKTT